MTMDGLRAVLFVSEDPIGLDEIRFLDWEKQPEFEEFKTKWLLEEEN